MQKKIIALAVAAVASSGAFAQSNVQIYGLVDYGVTYSHSALDGTPRSANVLRLNSGQSAGNRLGFKGVEDLGNGLKAVFVLERGLLLDTGADQSTGIAGNATGFGRQAYVGLASDYGTLAGGRIYTPYYTLVSSLDPFGDGTVGHYSNVKADLAGGLFNPVRVDNTIAYISPNWGGFGLVAAYSNNYNGADAVRTITDAAGKKTRDVYEVTEGNRVATLAANYTLDNIMVGLTYHHILPGAGLRVWNRLTYTEGKGAAVSAVDNVTLGGSYDLQVAKISAFWSWDKMKADSVNEVKPRNPQAANLTVNTFMIGAKVPFGKQALKASVNYSKAGKQGNTKVGNAIQFALGYDYAFSKRTNFYAAYALINNSKKATDAAGVITRAGRFAAVGDSSNASDHRGGFQLGVKHTF